MGEQVVEQAVAALRGGQLAVLPTDTVYGLCACPYQSGPARRLYAAKGRPETEPIALVASSLDMLFELVPELRGRAGTMARALLPGPLTLVLPNPGARYRWLTGTTPEKIGVRVPELADEARQIVEQLGAVAATSANLSGGQDPRSLSAVPQPILEACAVAIDGGELPGTPSTVIDLTGPEPKVLREGAVSAQDALEPLAALALPAAN